MVGLLRRKIRRVLIDIDTQIDAIHVNGRDRSNQLRAIRRLFAWARVNKYAIISTALARRADTTYDLPDDTPRCVEGTPGQKKIKYTIVPSSVSFGPENRLDLPRNILMNYRQVIFEKRAEDPFTQPRADRLLTDIRADELIVFGFGAEEAVKETVLGLLNRRKRVLIVSDAIMGQSEKTTNLALRQMETKGAKIVSTEYLTGKSKLTGKAGVLQRLKMPIYANFRSK
jgi:nicotinamidase-related amidase